MRDSSRATGAPVATPPAVAAPPSRFKSKTRAALLAFLFGSVGAHRFYLHGRRDLLAYAHGVGFALGLAGAVLVVGSDRASIPGWALAVAGTVSLLAAFLTAIDYGLQPDDKWDARFNATSPRKNRSGWGAVFVVILSLFIGAMLLMGGLAIAFQTYFESTVTPIDSR
jgi:TM2 domain-containing membrane protein YozV